MRIIRFIDEQGKTHHGEDAGDGTALILDGSLLNNPSPSKTRVRIAKPLAPLIPTDIICIGRNYHQSTNTHSAAINVAHSDESLEVFLKPSTSLQNPDDPILIPQFDGVTDVQLDCEGELAVVIGREARNVPEHHALKHVFGYTLANDITARHFQTASGGGPPLWMRGKGFDTFCPLGPAIVTADELPDPQNLTLRTTINGKVVREGNTREMIRSIPQIIAAMSRHMTIRAGSVILTGAPPAEPRSLTIGETVEVRIDPIGRLKNTVS